MSLSKVILILAISGLGLFALLLFYTLSPTIRNVSQNIAFKHFMNTQVESKTTLYLHQCDKGSYRFISTVISKDSITICNRLFDLPEGSIFLIKEIKKYTNNTGSGITSLFVLGECTSPEGNKVNFEFDWCLIDNTKGQTTLLPLAFWQDESDSRINYIN